MTEVLVLVLVTEVFVLVLVTEMLVLVLATIYLLPRNFFVGFKYSILCKLHRGP